MYVKALAATLFALSTVTASAAQQDNVPRATDPHRDPKTYGCKTLGVLGPPESDTAETVTWKPVPAATGVPDPAAKWGAWSLLITCSPGSCSMSMIAVVDCGSYSCSSVSDPTFKTPQSSFYKVPCGENPDITISWTYLPSDDSAILSIERKGKVAMLAVGNVSGNLISGPQLINQWRRYPDPVPTLPFGGS
ncbi:hypothetical protein ACJQWK_07295 [Exserohilum turcicum]|uniref:Secreted protein n=1 Tax=Exserohilum turcicum (strain 28A) TaxID=671987 RepID=R0K4S6_EXST2|nr:uncharacterized protein SETTUDRAFT_179246 [Exserohilum turcica Et28A]EOA84529.1 hypothetical protein SETTUDRAFT_179246 [Exserohilum turcica Et28A]